MTTGTSRRGFDRQVKAARTQHRACVFLLYEFPSRYARVSEYTTGAVDGASWMTRDDAGGEGSDVPSGAAVFVRGWALNLPMDGPAAHVVVIVDGTDKYHAHVGLQRPDVAGHFDDDRYMASGFQAIVTTGNLAPGEHTIEAYAVDPEGVRYAPLAGPATFTIVADWISLRLEDVRSDAASDGNLDIVIDESSGRELAAANGAVIVPRGANLVLHGWFSDVAGTAGISEGYVVVDAQRAYVIRYGLPRPDVATQLAPGASTAVGFEARIPTANLKRGPHSATIVGFCGEGKPFFSTPIALNFVVGQASSARIALDEMTLASIDDVVRVQHGVARDMGAPLRIGRDDRLFVRGWAFDAPALSVAMGVSLIIDGRIEMPALYGLPRPDVAEVHRSGDLARCGFTAEIGAAGLGLGLHRAECRVLAADGRGAYATTQQFEFEVTEN